MNIIITGATGMVGKAVLIECLSCNEIKNILVINRNPIDLKHQKLTEIIHRDFTSFSSIKNRLAGYHACFYCMGVSALGLNEKQYTDITYNTTKALAEILVELNPNMVFNYVSGTGTDGTAQGRIMWARVKGKTENMILEMGFKDAYAFRPGFILPVKGVKSKTRWYNAFYQLTRPLFPLLRKWKLVTLSSSIGLAMINTLSHPQSKKHLENADINILAAIEA